MRLRYLRLAVALTTVALLVAPTVAAATPVCTGDVKTPCGGRVFPEPVLSGTALTFAETVAGLESLAAEFPEWMTLERIGQSFDGFDLLVVEVTSPEGATPKAERAVVYVSQSIHGNEPGGREGGVRYLEDLLRGADEEHRALLDRVRLVQVLPNPDGWTAGDHDAVPDGDSVGVWKRGNGNGVGASDLGGVDLNRQFPWRGFIPPSHTPLSEPESQALAADVERRLAAGEDLVASTDIHGEVADAAAWIMLSSGEFDLGGMMTQVGHGVAVEAAVDAALSDEALVTLSIAAGQAVDAGILTASSEFGSPGIGGSGSGFLGDWLAQPEGGDTRSISTIELFAFDPSGPGLSSLTFRREIFQIYRDTVRAILQAMLEQAVVEHRPRIELPGPVGYVVDGRTVEDPILGDDRTPMRFFDDLAPYVSQPLRPIAADTVAGSLDGLAGVVVTSDLLADDAEAVAALRAHAENGGTLVLTDGALNLLPGLVEGISPGDVSEDRSRIGTVDLSPAPDHPLLDGVRDNAYLTVEPATLGYEVTGSGDTPTWRVARDAWEAAGGTTVGVTADAVNIGEIAVGDGVVRTAGLLLPLPTDRNRIEYGLNDHAVLDTGYRLFVNALDAELVVETVDRGGAVPQPEPATPAPTDEPAGDRAPTPSTGGGLAVAGLLLALTFARRRP